jgi:hypothetical protein
MNEAIKATHETAMARTPNGGWDAVIDVRRARKFLTDTGDVLRDGDGREDDLKMYIKALRSFGIRPRTAIAMLRDHFKDRIAIGDLELKIIARLTKDFYTFADDEPGIDSAAGDKVADDLGFKRNQFGKPIATDPYNIRVALARLGVKLRFDSFQCKVMISGLPDYGPILQDDAVNRLRFAMRDQYEFLPDETLLYKFLLDQARLNSFNPARDYFDEVEPQWDGVKRLDTFLIAYAGATDTPYVRAVGRLPFIAAVRRVRHPGAKFDEMLVLESSQGKNKSTAFEILAVRKEWFTDSVPLNAQGREILEHVEGKLFVEVAELQGMRKGEIEHVKANLSRTVDRGRMAYGRLQLERPRQFVFIGTSNGRSYLRDDTGNRRFWPVAVKEFNLAALKRDRDQIWAEAAFAESLGESIRLDPSLYEAAGREQNKRLEIVADPFTDAFRNYLGDRAGKITAEDAWAILGIDDAGRRTPDQYRRFGAALKACGWQRRTVKIEGDATNGYVRGQANHAQGHRRIVVTRGTDRRPFVEYEDEREQPSDTFG